MSIDIIKIIQRKKDTFDFIKEKYPHIVKEQKHLDEGSEARGYWHYGYLMALTDILGQLFQDAPEN